MPELSAALLDIQEKAAWDNKIVDAVLNGDPRSDLPNGTEPRLSALYAETLDLYMKYPSWTTLVLGPLFATLAEQDERKLRAGLVSLAATIVGWISTIDARKNEVTNG